MSDSNWIARDAGRAKRVRIVLGIFVFAAVFVGAASALELRVNWTESMPRGIYQRMEPVFERGGFVAVCLESRAAELARERGYVIDGDCPCGLAPIFKRLVGVPGDRIDLAMDGVAVNGAAIPGSEVKEVDSRGRPLERTRQGELMLARGRYFVMGMNPSRSWDSRYFGPVAEHQIVAGARPLWTF